MSTESGQAPGSALTEHPTGPCAVSGVMRTNPVSSRRRAQFLQWLGDLQEARVDLPQSRPTGGQVEQHGTDRRKCQGDDRESNQECALHEPEVMRVPESLDHPIYRARRSWPSRLFTSSWTSGVWRMIRAGGIGQGTIAPTGRGLVESLGLGAPGPALPALLQGLADRFLVGLAGLAPGLLGLGRRLGLGFRSPGLGVLLGLAGFARFPAFRAPATDPAVAGAVWARAGSPGPNAA